MLKMHFFVTVRDFVECQHFYWGWRIKWMLQM